MAASGIPVCEPVLVRKWQTEYGFASDKPNAAQIVLLPVMVHSKVTVAHCSPVAFSWQKARHLYLCLFSWGIPACQFRQSGSVGLACLQTRLFLCCRLVISDSWSMFHAPSFFTFYRLTLVFRAVLFCSSLCRLVCVT